VCRAFSPLGLGPGGLGWLNRVG
jgi:hypothetical protein